MVKGSFALITGASSGLGLEFAKQLAAEGYGIILVGRRAERLRTVAAEIEKNSFSRTEVIEADLVTAEGTEQVCARLLDADNPVRFLVNNAGYGLSGRFDQTSISEELEHLAIHIAAPLELTKAAISGMLSRRDGRVIIVSSIAGYLSRGTYSAHKSWGLNFARFMNSSYRKRGVNVSAVAPGFTRTEFHKRMNMDVANVPRALWLNSSLVVRKALRAVESGRAICIPTLRYKLLLGVAALVPRKWHQSFFN